MVERYDKQKDQKEKEKDDDMDVQSQQSNGSQAKSVASERSQCKTHTYIINREHLKFEIIA